MILLRRLITKLKTKEDSVLQRKTQAGNLTTNLKVKTDFILPGFSATKILTWEFHVGNSTKGGYDMILSRYLLTSLGLNIIFMNMSVKKVTDPLNYPHHP